MSAKGLFISGFTQKEVKAIQEKAKSLLMEGKTIMSWSDGGTSVTKQFSMPIADVLEECAYALIKLKRKPSQDGDSPSGSFVSYHFPL